MTVQYRWIGAYRRRIPSKATEVHEELRNAYLADLIREQRELETALAAEVERDLAKFVGMVG